MRTLIKLYISAGLIPIIEITTYYQNNLENIMIVNRIKTLNIY